MNTLTKGERLRHCREYAGYGLRKGAKAVGLSGTYLSHMEIGRVPITSNPETIERLIKVFHINYHDASEIFRDALMEARSNYRRISHAINVAEGGEG